MVFPNRKKTTINQKSLTHAISTTKQRGIRRNKKERSLHILEEFKAFGGELEFTSARPSNNAELFQIGKLHLPAN